MLTHAALWAALDALARRRGLTPSALARTAGLDPTSFNPSKRVAANGRPRWPGMEALAQALVATDTTLEQFGRLLRGQPDTYGQEGGHQPPMPLVDVSRLTEPGLFDEDGLPRAALWDVWHPAPAHLGPQAFAVRLDEPQPDVLLRVGSVVTLAPTAPLRPGVRVLAVTDRGALIGTLDGVPDRRVVAPLDGAAAITLPPSARLYRIAQISL
ncbi:putative transcriptional regulator [Ameyamaea chiangmaiensis NBRC 103196]|uniref:Helix-turn-helix transcriptional regulator n=1 Tax=Ameyamaea chiangmaiensis TaxID=442969 RepID=A0A850PHY1_9PROT|nr:helix-turn-helix transcriptional regulator [Ameyamaea chiangmaiensis]MBS4075733.1 helix-turn-helix transcriptional regulator [Ameyamaea chiangmaiensis]NVN40811.1 helix-turn-helix transcriptional regulator [Ameyamaea chiangmaiensis]GBQ70351.1 putative transcriptional regulator [Ameyamaea chiangmaiensis NBRC 103196]